MGDIFSRSALTIGFLGEPPSSLASIWNHVQDLQNIYTKAVSGMITENTPDVAWPPESFWKGLVHRFSNTFFKRVWTLQETVLAKRFYLMSRSDLFDWESVFVIAGCCSLLGSMEYFSSGSPSRRAAQLESVTVNHLGELRTLFHSKYPRDSPIYVSSIIQHSQSRSATKQSDHVFGTLGLLDKRTQAGLIINVKRAPSQVYVDFMVGLIKAHGVYICDQLRRAGLRTDSVLNLPSWCIDFSQLADTESLRTITDSFYNVSGSPALSVKQKISVDISESVLKLLGWQVSRVGEALLFTSDRQPVNEKPRGGLSVSESVVRTLDRCQEMAARAGVHDDLTLATTISAECRLARPERGVPRRPREMEYREWRQQIQDHVRTRGISHDGSQPVKMNSFGEGVSRACRNRAFFTTTDGRLGLGPQLLQTGDIVCAIFGCNMLLALRPAKTNKKENRCVLLGECMCHGLNFGELDVISQTQNLRTEEFLIE